MMMTPFLLVALPVTMMASLSASIPVQGDKGDASDCLIGPSFWCRSAGNMELCHAKSFCDAKKEKSGEAAPAALTEAHLSIEEDAKRVTIAMEEKKEPAKAKLGSNSTCQLCMEIAEATLKVADSPEGRAAAKVIMEQACRGLPNPLERRVCDLLVSPIVDVIYNEIEKHVNVTPAEICDRLRLCPPAAAAAASGVVVGEETPLLHRLKTALALHQRKTNGGNPIECQVCQFVMKYLKQYATEDNRKKLIQHFEDTICAQMDPSLQANCSAAVNKIVDQLFAILENESPLQICQTISACDAAEVEPKLTTTAGSVKCSACEMAASLAKQYATPENEKAALAYLDETLCSHVPAPDRANCSKMLEMTIGNLFSMLNSMTPRRFCEQIGVCGGGVAIGNNIECEFCQYASQVLAPYCTPVNEKTLVDYLNASICVKYVSPDERQKCAQLFHNATEGIFQLIVQGQLCVKLNICPEKSKVIPRRNIVKSVSIDNNIECELCQYATHLLAPYCTPGSEKTIVDYLNASICVRYVSPDERQKCAQLFHNATVGIFQLVVQGQLCTKLGICSEKTKAIPRKNVVESVNNNLECEFCQYASQMLAPYCTPENDKNLVDYLNASICVKYVSPDERQKCAQLFHNATEGIFQLVVQGQLCVKLGICPEKKKVVPWRNVVESVPIAKVVDVAKSEAIPVAKIVDVAKSLDENEPGQTNNVVINNINNNINNINTNVVVNTGNDFDTGKRVIDDSAAATAETVVNPVECSVCEYVGLALLLGQSPESACQTAFGEFQKTMVDVCLGFSPKFAEAMGKAKVVTHRDVVKLCTVNKYC